MTAYQEPMEHMAREDSATDNEEARRALEATAKALARHTSPDTRLGAWAPGGTRGSWPRRCASCARLPTRWGSTTFRANQAMTT
ncbi:hypothetical protein [Nocardiopsis alkaliphila]|uniref:hypothetical protein n=1 Tax=Nocardiopsis alkaliphila TaxID=225762 RepID=UPI0009FC6550|nr:hypothetical protein [Nocardiopsis alkaliphila]